LLILPAASAQKVTPSDVDLLVDSHEAALAALHSERAKLRLERSTLFEVTAVARGLRDIELRIATRPIERVAAFNRFRSLLLDLEADVKTPLDRKILDAEKARAESDLNAAKRNALQIEQINKQQRSLILEPRRDLWRKDLDGSPPVHPILPPKLAEKRR
jgi:hypothetical protein